MYSILLRFKKLNFNGIFFKSKYTRKSSYILIENGLIELCLTKEIPSRGQTTQ